MVGCIAISYFVGGGSTFRKEGSGRRDTLVGFGSTRPGSAGNSAGLSDGGCPVRFGRGQNNQLGAEAPSLAAIATAGPEVSSAVQLEAIWVPVTSVLT